jgi:hypothetical protein
MRLPTVEECDFDRQFLFGEYVAISHRYDLEKVYQGLIPRALFLGEIFRLFLLNCEQSSRNNLFE